MNGAYAYETILLRRDSDIATLVFNRPDRRNALTRTMMDEIAHAIAAVQDSGARALVLRGAGGAFSAGGDMSMLGDTSPAPADGEADPVVAGYRSFGDVILRFNALPLTTIAVVEGAAAGGGLGLACCSDIVLLHASARFGLPEPRAGFIPAVILPMIARRIGEGPLRDLAVSGRMMGAEEALRYGLGRAIHPSVEALEVALAECLADVLRMEPTAVRVAKRLALSCAGAEPAAVMDDACRTLVGLLRGDAAKAGIRAFRDKTPPPWAAGP
jgi:isohexenylglutaconyl-CoA hydratase